MERTYIDTLAQLIARSPTCYHAAATAAELLAAAGYAPLDEGQRWQLHPGGKYYRTRGGSALLAFRVPEHAPAGFRLAAAHGDSPCFKLKEHAALRDGGYLRLNTEVYGGLRMSSWFDRPLSVAGRLFTEEDGVLRQTLLQRLAVRAVGQQSAEGVDLLLGVKYPAVVQRAGDARQMVGIGAAIHGALVGRVRLLRGRLHRPAGGILRAGGHAAAGLRIVLTAAGGHGCRQQHRQQQRGQFLHHV